MEANAKIKAEITAVLSKLNEAYLKKDINGIMALFIPDNNLVVFALEEGKQIVGAAAYKAHIEHEFTMADDASFEVNWSSVSVVPQVAWVAAEVTIKALVKKNNKRTSIPARCTMVLENRQGKWLIAQSHYSAARPHSK